MSMPGLVPLWATARHMVWLAQIPQSREVVGLSRLSSIKPSKHAFPRRLEWRKEVEVTLPDGSVGVRSWRLVYVRQGYDLYLETSVEEDDSVGLSLLGDFYAEWGWVPPFESEVARDWYRYGAEFSSV